MGAHSGDTVGSTLENTVENISEILRLLGLLRLLRLLGFAKEIQGISREYYESV